MSEVETFPVVVATGNQHKIAEIEFTLKALVESWVVLQPFSGKLPPENGETFEENALIKARAAFRATGLPSIADDSGICVDSLGGEPGIRSARYTEEGTDAANLKALLENTKGHKKRDATFVCAVALVSRNEEAVVRGEWRGAIRTSARGEGGFGYDPIFVPNGMELTAAELSRLEKAALSHRGRALGMIAPAINRLVAGSRG